MPKLYVCQDCVEKFPLSEMSVIKREKINYGYPTWKAENLLICNGCRSKAERELNSRSKIPLKIVHYNDKEYMRILNAAIKRIVGDQQTTEDVVHNAFLKMLRRRDEFTRKNKR